MSRRDGGRGAGAPEQIEAFSRGLYPILLRADPVAFSRYLSQWEDVIGDTAELSATPPEQLRRTMSALLRRPQQFGLPAWGPLPPQATAAPAPEAPVPATRLPVPLPRTPVPADVPPAPPAEPPPVPLRGAYQVDMLTGELVPVSQAGIAEGEAAPYEAPEDAPPAQRKRRHRRRPPRGMKQLTFLPDLG